MGFQVCFRPGTCALSARPPPSPCPTGPRQVACRSPWLQHGQSQPFAQQSDKTKTSHRRAFVACWAPSLGKQGMKLCSRHRSRNRRWPSLSRITTESAEALMATIDSSLLVKFINNSAGNHGNRVPHLLSHVRMQIWVAHPALFQ